MSDLSQFDRALAELRDQCKRVGVHSVSVLVCADGRVLFDFGSMRTIHTDLLPGGAHPLPNEALSQLAGWPK